ncbi:low molecular weight protein-tyrosine-phosphatase [Sedimentitalea sp. XS_ASV28]|uniref:low molecular weight protein-tyrosine-phosphatase n=1 Tax=Sedimentitalea sp. XS_ASV28 TaxID=3241296 RepID=UPI0035125F83
MTTRVLFVCLGNICRSPAAEAVFRALRPDLATDSAGTAGYHMGEPPYGPMQDAARKRGIAMDDLRARQFTAKDFSRFDLILAMDADNLRDIEALRPQDAATPVHLLTDYGSTANAVPDPYYTRDFDGALDIIEAAAQGLAEALN